MAEAMVTVQVLYATDRLPLQPNGFANGLRGPAITFGDSSVRLEPGRNRGTDKDISITAMRREASTTWAARMQGQTVLLFVHGYNTSFEAVIKKAAQMKVDMPWMGPIVAFSWPSHGDTLNYPGDEALYPGSLSTFLDTINVLQVWAGPSTGLVTSLLQVC